MFPVSEKSGREEVEGRKEGEIEGKVGNEEKKEEKIEKWREKEWKTKVEKRNSGICALNMFNW